MRAAVAASAERVAWPGAPGLPRLRTARWESVFVVIATVMMATNIADILLSRGPAAGSYAAQVRLAFMAIYVIAGVLLLRSRSTLPTLLTGMPLLLVVLAMPAVSIVWSIDRGESIERVVAMLGTSLFGIYLGLRFTLGRMVFLLAIGLAVAAVLSIAVIFAVPSIGIAQDGPWAGTWIGFNFHKNGLGATAALGCIIIGYAITDSRGAVRLALMAAFALAAVLLAGSYSTTAMIGAASAGLLTAWTRMVQRLPREGPVLSLLIGFGLVIAVIGFVSMGFVETALNALGKRSDLSSRIPIWEIVWTYIGQRYWLGYGFEAFWTPGNPAMGQIERELYFLPFYSHNGVLETWLNGGILLVVIVAAMLLATIFRSARLAFRWRDLPVSSFLLAYCLYFVAMNFAESSILSRNSLTWVLMVAVTVFAAKWARARTA